MDQADEENELDYISKNYKVNENYFENLMNFKLEVLKKPHETINDETMDIICFLLTCPASVLMLVQNFFIFDGQINSWLKKLDTILREPSKKKWKEHWGNRLALKNQHVVKDRISFSYGLRKYNNNTFSRMKN